MSLLILLTIKIQTEYIGTLISLNTSFSDIFIKKFIDSTDTKKEKSKKNF